jgi:phenylacetic acid degradation operon negative regulatory protein
VTEPVTIVTEDDASPRVFLLALLRAFACDVQVQMLIRAGALFDIDENRTRVALHRLRAKGLIESRVRGTYCVVDTAIQSEHHGWRHALSRVATWGGRWLGVHTGHLPRADKTVARRRDKATNMLGLRELEPGLLVRPDNLMGGVAAARARLHALGLEPEAPVMVLSDLGQHEHKAHRLWDDMALNAVYEDYIRQIRQITEAIPSLPVEEAARQVFVVGGRALHDILLDPLLPAPLVDPDLRQHFVQSMIAFDDLAREVWGQALETKLTLRQAPAAAPEP